ncbi:FtsX-like permease family protein [Paenibacillus albiflavus]|uniref:FtsX-like permease family protein n=1 Tax=Paenibacillus albiflavus TaxID=2545760 RepID=A0A4R4E3Y4_9BACL|nr:FtsX-like permease family protein [Paenibacillus albiflavus]TCZ71061.1 FtsX-like permease family protein [Paenibacillus albiflavus]
MLMLRFLYRKMWKTRWLTISTLLGLIVAVAFTTSIPMYADGALKRVVAKTLEQTESGMPPGSLLMRYQATGSVRADMDAFNDVDRYIREEIPQDITFAQQTYARALSLRGATITPVDPSTTDGSKRRQMSIAAFSGLKDKVELASGKWPSDQLTDGMVEVIVLEEAMFRLDMHVGDVYNYPISAVSGMKPLQVKIVGKIKPLDEQDPYWFQGFEGLLSTLVVSEPMFMDQLLDKSQIPLNLANWYYAFDLKEIQTSQIPSLERTLTRLDMNLFSILKDTKVDQSFLGLLSEFKTQGIQLQLMLFTLAAPILGMVLYYIVMNARQSLDRQRTDIAVIRSRGGSTNQIIWIYLLEGIILGAIAMIIGPALGWFVAKSIGSANGFLTFVDRKSIPVGFTIDAALYGLGAVLLAIIATVIPAIMYARSSIVGNKQKQARTDRKPFWQRWFLDIVLLGLVAYGWYLFNSQQLLSQQTGLTTDQMQVQPVLFFVPALAIFALGMFFLRVFPWILKLLSWIGKKVLPVSMYLTLTQLSRSSKSYYPLMLLLTLTIGLGVYNASAARTLDLNSTERTLYNYGTDVIMELGWESVSDDVPTGEGKGKPNPNPNPNGGGNGGGNGGNGGNGGGNGGGGNGGGGGQPGNEPPRKVRFIEPRFQVFTDLEGVEHAARVLRTKGSAVAAGKSLGTGEVMGIDNDQFAQVAWFRNDLFPVHPFKYLNLLGMYEQAVIIPTSFAEKYGLKQNDMITISINQQSLEFVIVATLPYWPSEYPDDKPFFITNLEYIYDQMPVIPYQIWLKIKDDALVGPMMTELQDKGVILGSVKDVKSELARQSKHPSRGGVFGILSLGFLVSVLISLIGYLLYWYFNLLSRIVQFGVLRAMGLKRKQLTGMLLLEQILTGGLAIAIGIGVGRLVSLLFLPFLQTAENVKQQVPPFRIIFEAKDTLQLYIVIIVMMITGASLLFVHIRRLRVHQAIKLGEER